MTEESLTRERALGIGGRVAQCEGWPAQELRVLGPIGENANLLLPDAGVVLRICSQTGLLRARRELAVAQWLKESGVPAVRTRSEVPRLDDSGWVITLWDFVPQTSPGSPAVIGGALRRLHRLRAPEKLSLPALDPFAGIDEYIHRSALGALDKEFLQAHLAGLRFEASLLNYAVSPGPVHGDAHRKNIVQNTDGQAVVLDLERFSVGAREWDLVVAAVYERVGWYTAEEYRAFVDAYGWDVRDWSGFETLAAVRELRMTAWLCARTAREPRLLPEARRRVVSLRDPSLSKRWMPGT
ncbi:phosphotransferase enzyme family protein [Nocardiopsis changdeensis]|uniref:Aminoglycoside phosphotransferase family protein n=1 Tax=Nocardiopsis changdeensis TaxID=2831969 RepID=A0ABX8BEC6_9ACTN|nr:MULTISPECIES: aminoglycoside phosphotransferase family protein [Nocardiopsis]QUX20600.1 aminoglycoside phosphotransferase family protein [Nocardiopsis changdeensis]QYX36531.1 aminoglycoside phosphotransferase family protein [Nocardiopsis sp. MT53]